MSSTSYVLAEYNGQTRKIQGIWNNRSYKTFVKEISSKFNIDRDQEIEIKVYDKKNNKYFSIDRSEMNEIPRGGLIRIVNMQKTKTKRKQQQLQQQTQKQKGKSSPLKPPGVPPYSKEDDHKRNQWQISSKVEIYSEGQKKWQKGEIVDIFEDTEGEWIVINYAGFRTKEIQRFSNYIRPLQKEKKQQNKKQQSAKEKEKKQQKQTKETKDTKQVQETKVTKAKEAQKITTQSKYRKKEKIPSESTLQENEIEIRGNSSHIKKYIDRACVLLRGYDAGHSGYNGDSDTKSNQYDVIYLFGTGRAMSFVVSTAEIVQRIIGGLHQVTVLESIQKTEHWMPLEQGLKEVQTTRSIAQLKITLAVNGRDIDKKASGYQDPIGIEAFAANLEYHYGDEEDDNTSQGKGVRKGRGF